MIHVADIRKISWRYLLRPLWQEKILNDRLYEMLRSFWKFSAISITDFPNDETDIDGIAERLLPCLAKYQEHQILACRSDLHIEAQKRGRRDPTFLPKIVCKPSAWTESEEILLHELGLDIPEYKA